MSRNILDEAHIHPAIRDTVGNSNVDIVREVQAAIAVNPVVVVGPVRIDWPEIDAGES